jgi:hypothetical protein
VGLPGGRPGTASRARPISALTWFSDVNLRVGMKPTQPPGETVAGGACGAPLSEDIELPVRDRLGIQQSADMEQGCARSKRWASVEQLVEVVRDESLGAVDGQNGMDGRLWPRGGKAGCRRANSAAGTVSVRSDSVGGVSGSGTGAGRK